MDVRRRVGDLGGVDPGHRAAEHVARAVAARFERAQPDCFEDVPDRRHVLDPDPVQLHVLPVSDVSQVAAVRGRDVPDRPQLVDGELPAGDADAHHEVAVVELLGLEQAGLAAADAGPALGVEAHPAHPAAQIGAVDRVEPGLGVDVEDPALHVQRIVVLLHPLVGVQRLAHAKRPLALAARLPAFGVRSANPRDGGLLGVR